jgi:hypothetical protein
VARAFEACELGAPKKFTQEQIFDGIKKGYQQRLQTNDIIKSDPNNLCDEYWKACLYHAVFPRCKNDNHKNLIFRPTSWPRLNIEERI